MATSVNISSYSGSVSGANWSPSVLAAWADIKTTGGTINIDNDIKLESETRYDVSGTVDYTDLWFRGDSGSRIEVHSPGAYTFYTNGNRNKTLFTDLNFIGNTVVGSGSANYYNAQYLIMMLGANKNIIERCMFAGIAASGSLIYAYSGAQQCIIRDSSFSGCGGTSGVVQTDGIDMLRLENVEFYDYQNYRAVNYNKAGYAPTWIVADYGGTPATAHVPMVHLSNVRTDEGTNFCSITGYPFVKIENCAANVSTSGQSVYLEDVANARITDCWFGYVASDIPAIKLVNCGDVVIEGIQKHNGVKRVVADAGTRVIIRASPGIKLERI